MAQTSREYSLGRLRELGKKLGAAELLLSGHPLCVCATGSYGRLEAWEHSDADVFFLYDDADETQRLPVTSFIRFAALLIDTADEMQFPPFSGDGRYLEVQYVGEMENVLGSPGTTRSTLSPRGCCCCSRANRSTTRRPICA